MNHIRKTLMGLSPLMIDEEISFDTVTILDHVVHYYTTLFTAQDWNHYDTSIPDNFIQLMLTPDDSDMLTVLPNAEEIRRAIFDMDSSSFPGPNNFGGNFY
ncbi:hypothetical protein ACS0TY_010993 [Phlomoides rotata]